MLDSKIPIIEAIVDVGYMVVVVMVMVESMLTVEESSMVPVHISPMIDVMVTINIRPLVNIPIMLMKI